MEFPLQILNKAKRTTLAPRPRYTCAAVHLTCRDGTEHVRNFVKTFRWSESPYAKTNKNIIIYVSYQNALFQQAVTAPSYEFYTKLNLTDNMILIIICLINLHNGDGEVLLSYKLMKHWLAK